MDWIPRLTPFELDAAPRVVDFSRDGITLTAHSLTDVGQEMKCPICLELMNSVMVTECLHRFCKDCIVRHLRQMGQKRECPICRVNIRTGRSLRKDERMDALIALFFPGGRESAIRAKEEASAFNRSDIAAASQRHQQMIAVMREKQKAARQRNEELQRIAAASARADAEARAKAATEIASRKRNLEELERERGPPSSSWSSSLRKIDINSPVTFALRQYPGEKIFKEVVIGEFKTSASATVRHLKSFVRALVEASNPGVPLSQVDIIVTVPPATNSDVLTSHTVGSACIHQSENISASSYKIVDSQLPLGALYSFFGDRKINPVLVYRPLSL